MAKKAAKKPKICPLCASRGRPADFGSAPVCAFTGAGKFRPNNWMCATMLALRTACTLRDRDDMSAGSIGVLRMPEDGVLPQGWLVLTWYKDRGTTSGAVIVGDTAKRYELTLARARRMLTAGKLVSE